MNRADRKAQIAASRASARRHPDPILMGEPPDMPGWSLWRVGIVAVVVPRLLPGAPSSIRRQYQRRIIANATGECSHCDTVATDPVVSSHASLAHDQDCPVRLLEVHAERWLDPRAHGLRAAMAGRAAS
jgi:hypothetical protein